MSENTTDEGTYIARLRRNADGALDSIARRADNGEQVGWRKDWWNGYKQALEDVESQQDEARSTTADAQTVDLNRRLDALSQMVSDNVMRGFVNTVEIRQWIEETRDQLPAL